jgi:hypothetical protein
MKFEHDRAPNGWYVDGLILYGGLERGAIAAKGFMLTPPDLRGASDEQKNAFQDRIVSLLALLQAGQRLQVQWSCHSDYRRDLTRYHEATPDNAPTAIRRVRQERYARHWARAQDRELRREQLVIFLTMPVTEYAGNLADHASLKGHYHALLKQLQARFDDFGRQLESTFGQSTRIQPMNDVAHFAFVQRFLNPSVAGRNDYEPAAQFDASRTLQDLCWNGDGQPRPSGGFYLDDHAHLIFTVKRWPRQTRPGIVTYLTGIPFLDYSITVNLEPLPLAGEIRQEEKAMERLAGEYAQKPQPSVLVAMRKKERKVENLATGAVRPFRVQYIVRVWDQTEEGLRQKADGIKAAVHDMNGADYYANAQSIAAKKLFFASWPGWTNSSYHYRDTYAEDRYLADLLPFSATFTGHLSEAEAVYDGAHENLAGVRTFVGGSPQHAVLLGMTGAGKSLFMRDLLEQTAPYFGYTVIVEEGLSYKDFTESQGETPIVVQPDGTLTLNYFDTQGLPLSQLQRATAVALLSRMIGELNDPERAQLRQAQLAHYVERAYEAAFAAWQAAKPAQAAQAGRLACAAQSWLLTRMPKGSTIFEAFKDFRERERAGDVETARTLAGLTEEVVVAYVRDSAQAARNLAFAYFKPEDFPTHGDLVKLLRTEKASHHQAGEIDRLATLLGAWQAGGTYGKLFDGVTNVTLQGKVAHFELGLIPEQATELKVAAALLVTGFVRQHILSLPRDVRKRVIFEEGARFLGVPGGAQIMEESYAQLRKFNCWAISIFQQYAKFRESQLRAAVIGNAKQFFILRQGDRTDLEALARDIGLPESAIEVIMRYPLPEQLAPDQRHSSICYFVPAAEPPFCGTLRHYTRAA